MLPRLFRAILLASLCALAVQGDAAPEGESQQEWEVFRASSGDEVETSLELSALFGVPDSSEPGQLFGPQTTATEPPTACRIPKRQNLPTFTVEYTERYTTIPNSGRREVCLDNRELMNSMCKGMKKNQQCDTNQMRLTYKPSSSKTNRENMCPDKKSQKFCADQDIDCDPAQPQTLCNPYSNYMKKSIGSYKHDPFHLTCDEFPFANSAQGGDPNHGTSICIPGWQNSYQGGKLNQLSRKVGAGNDYIVEVTGWDCKTGRPTKSTQCGGRRKREELEGASLNEEDFFPSFTDDGKNALMMYLGDVEAGTYTYTLSVGSGSFSEVRAIDARGNTLAEFENGLQTSTESRTFSFQLSEEVYGVSLWAFTSDKNVSLAYNITTTPASEASGSDESGAVGLGYRWATIATLFGSAVTLVALW
ncbi:hypothetical protein jhhlp_008785 [Lomentospora prolificans]|uniref:Deoxyribonuclease NucA/NucB domain-containing protein n=1 Tax=Lomentospora prolificans TaxID=41688 RepID=A0A2N3MZ13_9PEZI|nr:hypothetical protein jhhlp_008785 [Lomentospora prolificans]